MHIIGKAKKVSIYIGESDKWGRKPLHMAILDLLKRQHCAGATVTRALAGFGAHSQIRTASLVSLSSDLPLVVEWVDNPARVERILPKVQDIVTEGLITVQDVDVSFYSHRGLRHLSGFVPVQDVMTRAVRKVTADTSLAKAAELLLDKVQKSLVVVDDSNRVIGILTDGDLLSKVDLPAISASQYLTEDELEAEQQRLRQLDQTVGDVMTPNPVTVSPDTTIPEAVELMLKHDIKRLPVADESRKPVGVVSRVDILRAFAQPLAAEAPRQSPSAGRYGIVEEVMSTNVPAVHMHTSLAEIVTLLVSNVQRRVVIVDGEQRVVGIITDGDLIKRAKPTERSGIIYSLTHRLQPGQSEGYELSQRPVAEVMTQPVITVSPNTSLPDALELLLKNSIKRLPVVDGRGQLVGLVGRGGILQALGQESDLDAAD